MVIGKRYSLFKLVGIESYGRRKWGTVEDGIVKGRTVVWLACPDKIVKKVGKSIVVSVHFLRWHCVLVMEGSVDVRLQ